jgi:hypothetical protein
MPYPGVPDALTSAVENCVEDVMEEGKSKDEAVPICIDRVMKGRAMLLPMANRIFNQILQPGSIRAVEGKNPYRFRVDAVLFGDSDHKDLYNTYFDSNTRYYLDWFSKRPWLYHHGLHPELRMRGMHRIGTWDTAGINERGVFLEGELDRHHEYIEDLMVMARAGLLFPSSGTLDYLATIDEGGHVEEWPIVEVSSTVTPGEWRHVLEGADADVQRAYRALSQTGGKFIMAGLGDRIRDLLSRRDAPEVEEEVHEGEGEEEEVEEDVQVSEGEGEDETSEEPEGDEELVRAIRALDGHVETLTSRLVNLEEQLQDVQRLALVLAEEEPTRAKRAMTDPEWYRSLFSVRTNVEDLEVDEDEQNTRSKNEPGDRTCQDGGQGGGGIFAAIRGS